MGSSIKSIKDVLENFSHLEKNIYLLWCRCFNEALKSSDKKNIIIAGIESHVCSLHTVLDLFYNNYQPVLIEDCVSSRNPNDKRIVVKRMRDEGAIISNSESILFELCEVLGSETFKTILKIVK